MHYDEQKLIQNMLLFVLLVFPYSAYCMEKEDVDQPLLEGQNISPIQSIPDELLSIIFQYKIHQIINTHDTAQAKEEFKILLSALRLTNRKFYQFQEELKKYFLLHKKIEVSDIEIDLDNYTLSFKIGNVTFKSDANDEFDMKFLENIVNPAITEEALTRAGEELAKKTKKPHDLRTLANDILRAEWLKDTATTEQKNRTVTLMMPILIAYKNARVPTGESNIYWTGNNVYKFLLERLFGEGNEPAILK